MLARCSAGVAAGWLAAVPGAGVPLFRSCRYGDGPLLFQLGQGEEGGERIERAQNQQLLQVEAPVDERDEVALLRAQVEPVEVGQELGAELRYGLHPLRVGQEVAHDVVADDLRI